MWGYGEGLYTDPELNRQIQLNRVQRFIYDSLVRPVRIVIDETGCLWCDNLHTALSYIISKENLDLCLYWYDVPCYIVDMRSITPVIVDGYSMVDLRKVKGLLEVCRDRVDRTSDGIRSVGYTIEEFIKDNRLYKECLTIPETKYDVYSAAWYALLMEKY